MSKEGRWEEMASLISDEILEAIAVVGRRSEIPDLLHARLHGLADAASIENTRAPDPNHFADIVAAIKARA